MKSIMAEAESGKPSNLQVSAVPYRTATPEKTAQRERYKTYSPMPAKAAERSSNSTASPRSNCSPWTLPPAPAISLMRPLSYQTSDFRPLSTNPLPTGGSMSQSLRPGFGPVFIPSRQPSAKSTPSSIQRVSYVIHWDIQFIHTHARSILVVLV